MNKAMYAIHSNISWKLLEDAVVAVNLDDGNYYTFNPTSGMIWQYVDDGKSPEEIIDLMSERFAETGREEIERDVWEIIRYWETEKLIFEKV
jgi:hypothetical protein